MYVLYLLLLSAVCAQRTTIDPTILEGIFGTPSPAPEVTPSTAPEVSTSQRLEDITVRPTDASSVFVDANGEQCKCVPYYLCDTNLNAIDVNNASVTGFGTLDIRFGEDDCQESTELCCKNPKNENEVPLPEPDASRLKGCGYRNPNGLDFTITGGNGNEAQFGEFPWVTAILNDNNGSFAGVGVLIHPQVVMTGAHVVQYFQASQLRIRAGEWDTQTTKERLRHQERKVREIFSRKDFVSKSVKNDISLLLLEEPVQLSDHINVLCLPEQDENFDSYKGCIANGWGKDVFGREGRYAVILKKVEMDMVPYERCNRLLQRTRLGTNFRLHHSFVCAGGEEGKDTCQGDGGAPLACPLGNDRYKLAGLVAWGIGCGQKDVPAVYAAVANFRRWVDDQMQQWGLDTSGYNI